MRSKNEKQPPECVLRKNCSKNFVRLTRKHLPWIVSRPAILKKCFMTAVFLKSSQDNFFTEQLSTTSLKNVISSTTETSNVFCFSISVEYSTQNKGYYFEKELHHRFLTVYYIYLCKISGS